MNKVFLWGVALVLFALPVGAGAEAAAKAHKIETLVKGLETPWSVAFLPNGDKLITELEGRLRLVKADNRLVKKPVTGVPKVFYAGQGGLMDVAVDPQFKRNRFIYLSYAAKVKGARGGNGTHLMRAIFQNGKLSDQKVIFVASPSKRTPVHYGGRIAFMKDGTLLLTLGDGFDLREEAQNPKTHFGSIVRLNKDGSVPQDNPFAKNKKGKAEIWTLGHRNAQAIIVDKRGRVFMNEHGPQGGDEINLIEKGKNYGWPIITYGVDYSGVAISPWTAKEGLEQPLYYWTPSIAPSGMAMYEGRLFPAWRGSLFVSSLLFGRVERLTLKGDKIEGPPEIVFKNKDWRVRDVRVGPRGAIYLLEENSGSLLKITPK